MISFWSLHCIFVRYHPASDLPQGSDSEAILFLYFLCIIFWHLNRDFLLLLSFTSLLPPLTYLFVSREGRLLLCLFFSDLEAWDYRPVVDIAILTFKILGIGLFVFLYFGVFFLMKLRLFYISFDYVLLAGWIYVILYFLVCGSVALLNLLLLVFVLCVYLF